MAYWKGSVSTWVKASHKAFASSALFPKGPFLSVNKAVKAAWSSKACNKFAVYSGVTLIPRAEVNCPWAFTKDSKDSESVCKNDKLSLPLTSLILFPSST